MDTIYQMFRYKSTTDRLISIYRLNALYSLVISNRGVTSSCMSSRLSSVALSGTLWLSSTSRPELNTLLKYSYQASRGISGVILGFPPKSRDLFTVASSLFKAFLLYLRHILICTHMFVLLFTVYIRIVLYRSAAPNRFKHVLCLLFCLFTVAVEPSFILLMNKSTYLFKRNLKIIATIHSFE